MDLVGTYHWLEIDRSCLLMLSDSYQASSPISCNRHLATLSFFYQYLLVIETDHGNTIPGVRPADGVNEAI